MSQINVNFIDELPANLASRPLTEEGIQIVYQSILTKGVSRPRIYLLIWEEDLKTSNYMKWNASTRTLVFNNACKGLTVRPTGVKFYPIVGNHTKHSFLRHLKRKPNSLAYKFVDVKYVVCKKTEKNRKLAVDLGRFDNLISDARKKIDVWDTLWSLHQAFSEIYSANLDNKSTKSACRLAKEDLMQSSGIPDTTMGSYSAVATFTGTDVWPLIQRCFEGDSKADGFVKATSLTPFKSMSGVPHVHLCRWLTRILDGAMKLNVFKEKCEKHKKTVRIQKEMVLYVNETQDTDCADYKELVERFPCLDDVAWFKMMRGWCSNDKKDGRLATSVKQAIKSKLKAWKEEQQLRQQVLISSSFYIIYMYYVYIYVYI